MVISIQNLHNNPNMLSEILKYYDKVILILIECVKEDLNKL